MPTHKSYLDFIILGYVHYYLKVEHPFVCQDEALFNIAFFSYLIKSGGGFKLNKDQMKGGLYKTVFSAYI
jgi:glycerol-3-phosphate O-acyltransferase